ncbi:MAG: immunoglobulin domain-containing protein, partial [Verrucomicrobiota bacterium]
MPTAWTASTGTEVLSLHVAGQNVLIASRRAEQSVTAWSMAVLDRRTGIPVGGNVRPNGPIYEILPVGQVLYVAGEFNRIGLETRFGLAAFDLSTGDLLPFNPGPNNAVFDLAHSGNKLFVAGDFTRINGVDLRYLAAIDLQTGRVIPTWNPSPGHEVRAISARGDTLYVAGQFYDQLIGGASRRLFAALDANTGKATPWKPNPTGGFRNGDGILAEGETIYVAGSFDRINGQPRKHLAALRADTGEPTDWNPEVGAQFGDGTVSVLHKFGDVVYASGLFLSESQVSRSFLAGIDAHTGRTLPWDPNPRSADLLGAVRCLASAADGMLFAGGNFTTIGGVFQPNFAAFAPQGSPQLLGQPNHQTVARGRRIEISATATGTAPLRYQWFFNNAAVQGGTNPTLTIGQTEVSHSGRYRVVVTNDLGLVASHEAFLTVLDPVQIVSSPQGQIVTPGQDVIMRVIAAGNPAPHYQWRLNGVSIPGAVFDTLNLTNVQPAQAGIYTVLAANKSGATNSGPAELIVNTPSFAFSDRFAARSELAASGVASGQTLGATRELNEPNHAGKGGGASVWCSWTAPADGIVVIHTRGSAFDTLLAVYAGESIELLEPIASDDDSGGFLASLVAFNASKDAKYAIAIDGFFGAAGNLVLNWSQEATIDSLPRITLHPQSQTVAAGENVTFTAVATPSTATYQWLFNCHPLEGQTNASLTVPNVGPAQVGLYSVLVRSGTREIESDRATLQINSTGGQVVKTFARDKLGDVLVAPRALLQQAISSDRRAARRHFVSIPQGSTGLQIFNTFGATKEPGETNH